MCFEMTEKSQTRLEPNVAMRAQDDLKVFGDVLNLILIFYLVLEMCVHKVTVNCIVKYRIA